MKADVEIDQHPQGRTGRVGGVGEHGGPGDAVERDDHARLARQFRQHARPPPIDGRVPTTSKFRDAVAITTASPALAVVRPAAPQASWSSAIRSDLCVLVCGRSFSPCDRARTPPSARRCASPSEDR